MTEDKINMAIPLPTDAAENGELHPDAESGKAAASALKDDVQREMQEVRSAGDDAEWAPIPVGGPKTEHPARPRRGMGEAGKEAAFGQRAHEHGPRACGL